MATNIEKRVAKLEESLNKKHRLEQLERRSFDIAKTVLFLVALTAIVAYGLRELAEFLIELFVPLLHSVGL